MHLRSRKGEKKQIHKQTVPHVYAVGASDGYCTKGVMESLQSSASDNLYYVTVPSVCPIIYVRYNTGP